MGKSWLVDKLFGPPAFRKVHWLDFRAEPRLAALFAESLDPTVVVGNIEIKLNERIDLRHDLLFLDEIGECQLAGEGSAGLEVLPGGGKARGASSSDGEGQPFSAVQL